MRVNNSLCGFFAATAGLPAVSFLAFFLTGFLAGLFFGGFFFAGLLLTDFFWPAFALAAGLLAGLALRVRASNPFRSGGEVYHGLHSGTKGQGLEPDFPGWKRLRRRDFVTWAGEGRRPYREYGQAL